MGLARNNSGDHGIEVHRLGLERTIQLLGDGTADLHVNAGNLLSAEKFIRRERRLRNHLQGIVILLTTAREHRGTNQDQN